MNNIEAKLEEALNKAIDKTSETGDASEAVAKVASDMNLSPKEIHFVANTYNTSKSFALGNKLDENNRPAEFDLADPETVVSKVYPEMDKVASVDEGDDADSVKLPDLDSVENTPLLNKAASKIEDQWKNYTPSLSQHDKDLLIRKISSLEERFDDVKAELCRALHKTASQHKELMKQNMHKAADEFVRYSDDNKPKVSRRIKNGFGDKLGKLALDTIEKISGKGVPEVQKTASHNIFPPDNIYKYIANAKDYADKHKKIASLHENIQKTGVVGEAAEKATGALLPQGNLGDELRKGLGQGEREKTWKEEMPADLFSKLKALEARDAFMKAMIKNPHLQEFSLPALQASFNYAMETNPELVDSPQSLSNVMLHNINTMGIDDLYALKTKEDLSKSQVGKGKEKAEKETKEKDFEDKIKTERKEAQKEAQFNIPAGNISEKLKADTDIPGKMRDLLSSSVDKMKEKREENQKKEQQQKDEKNYLRDQINRLDKKIS